MDLSMNLRERAKAMEHQIAPKRDALRDSIIASMAAKHSSSLTGDPGGAAVTIASIVRAAEQVAHAAYPQP